MAVPIKKTSHKTFDWFAKRSVSDICQFFVVQPMQGLADHEVHGRQKEYGKNIINHNHTSFWRLLVHQFNSAYIYLLCIVALITAVLGQPIDAFLIFLLITINTIFGIYQECKTNIAIKKLKRMVLDTTLVLRNGKTRQVTNDQLVPGDIVILAAGDRIPADVRFITTVQVTVDESNVTGQKKTMAKSVEALDASVVTVAHVPNIGFCQSLMLTGSAQAVVCATGNATYISSLEGKEKDDQRVSDFAIGLARFSRFILYASIIVVMLVFLLHWMMHVLIAGSEFHLVTSLLFSLTLGITIIPEALPLVLSFSLARGAVAMAKKNVIVRRLSAIEDLGSMNLLCIDAKDLLKNNIVHNKDTVHNENAPEVTKNTIAAIAGAQRLGIIIKLISQEDTDFCLAIARSISLEVNDGAIITGAQLSRLTGQGLHDTIEKATIFAAVGAQQKAIIIDSLQNKYDVGYLAHDIYDVAAEQQTHVSFASKMASDTIRENADIILMRKVVPSIIDAIHQGRLVFANSIKYMKSTLAANFGHFYSLAFVSLFIDFLPMRPSQLLLVNMLVDIPFIAISTDSVDQEQIDKPHTYNVKNIAMLTAIAGIVIMLADFAVFFIFLESGATTLQTSWFITSILVELSFFYSIRTRRIFFKAQSPSWIIMGASTLVACLAVGLPFSYIGQHYFHFKALGMIQLLQIAMIVTCFFFVTEVIKMVYYDTYE